MAGGLPRTNAAMRFVVKSWVTATVDCIPLNFATRLLKYGTTSGLVSSNTMLVVDPPDEEHPATRPGTAIAAAPRPAAFIIDRRLSTGPPSRALEGPGTLESPAAPGARVLRIRWFRPGRGSLSRCTAALPQNQDRLPRQQRRDDRSSGTINHMKTLYLGDVKGWLPRVCTVKA